MNIKRLFLLLLPLFCMAATAQVPELLHFSPDSRTAVQECKMSTMVYLYFPTGSKIASAIGRVKQDGQVLGDITFKGYTPNNQYASMKPTNPDNEPTMSKLVPGEFDIEVYSVTYTVGTETFTHTSETPLGTTTYRFPILNGTIVSETELKDNTLLSYYPADGTDGVLTYVFSKPLDPSALLVQFEYGGGDMPYLTRLPWSLSDDGLTLTLDLRGKAYDSSTLAYGNIFYDLNGNPTDPPSTIALTMSNLVCTDGSKVSTIAASLDGKYKTTIEGRMHKSLNYHDISFATPVLKSAAFYPASDPSNTHSNIATGCDMMALTVLHAEVLAKADITFTSGATVATVAWDDITKDGEIFTCALPSEIIAEGSDALIISLTDYSFKEVDGAEHIIKPLNLSTQMKEVTSVAAIKALESGETVILNVPGGVKVTLSNDAGYCFIEDDNDGLFIVTEDYTKVLQESTLLTGKLCGTYQGDGTFMILPAKSDYTEISVNTSVGAIQASLLEVLNGTYDNRLVSVIASSSLPIVYDGTFITIGEELIVVTDFAPGLEVPEHITDVTGVIYYEPNFGQRLLLIRNENDINQDINVSSLKTLAELLALGAGTEFSADVENIRITFAMPDYGITFMEDDTRGVQVATDDDEIFLETGKQFTGHIEGMNYDGNSIIYLYRDKCELLVEDVDVTQGAITNVNEALQPENSYRLATFTAGDNCVVTSDGVNVFVNDKLAVVDMFGIFDEDYIFPEKIIKVTGIIYPMSVSMRDGDDDIVSNTLLLPRSAADIVSDNTNSITNAKATTGTEVYNLQGIRVRPTSGLYISAGKKLLVK